MTKAGFPLHRSNIPHPHEGILSHRALFHVVFYHQRGGGWTTSKPSVDFGKVEGEGKRHKTPNLDKNVRVGMGSMNMRMIGTIEKQIYKILSCNAETYWFFMKIRSSNNHVSLFLNFFEGREFSYRWIHGVEIMISSHDFSSGTRESITLFHLGWNGSPSPLSFSFPFSIVHVLNRDPFSPSFNLRSKPLFCDFRRVVHSPFALLSSGSASNFMSSRVPVRRRTFSNHSPNKPFPHGQLLGLLPASLSPQCLKPSPLFLFLFFFFWF